MKEALKNLSKIIGEFGDRIQEAMKDFDKPELPVVWAEKEDKNYKAVCPYCTGEDSHRYILCDQGAAFARSFEGFEVICHTNESEWKKYIIRIRPDKPVEDYPEGSRWHSVQWWPREKQTGKGKPVITEGVVRGGLFFDSEGKNTSLPCRFGAKHFSLHRTYDEALTVAAGLWMQDGTTLFGVPNSGPYADKIRGYKYIKGFEGLRFHNDYSWTKSAFDPSDENSFAYLGPDRALADKICAEKNAEMKPVVDDSVLDKVITTSELVSMTEAYPLSPMMVWIWGIKDPTWDELLGRKPAWAQWIVDNLAGDIDAKVLEALKARLEASK